MPKDPPRWLIAVIAAALVPVAAVVVWSVWVYTTWALQARTAGWVSALAIASVGIGIGVYQAER